MQRWTLWRWKWIGAQDAWGFQEVKGIAKRNMDFTNQIKRSEWRVSLYHFAKIDDIWWLLKTYKWIRSSSPWNGYTETKQNHPDSDLDFLLDSESRIKSMDQIEIASWP